MIFCLKNKKPHVAGSSVQLRSRNLICRYTALGAKHREYGTRDAGYELDDEFDGLFLRHDPSSV